MKIVITLAMLCALWLNVMAQAPQKMSYQAVIRDAGGNLVTNTQVGMRITILEGALPGTAVYQETQTPTTNDNGLVTIEIGGGTGFDTIKWGNGTHFIKTETDPDGSTNYTISGTSQLLSVPYALYAKTAEMANDEAIRIYVNDLFESLGLVHENFEGLGYDIDGNIYKTLKIGNQIWMAENLKTRRYNDGNTIPLVTDITAWSNLTTPGYCWYNNDRATYGNTYGALYNWHAVNTYKLCPEGWHVPSDAEWTTLTTFLGGEDVAGGKMKETGTFHWMSPNTGATDECGFSALPGGYRGYNGSFYGIGSVGIWWSSMEYSASNAWGRDVYNDLTSVNRDGLDKKFGFSIRCVRNLF